MDKKVMIHFIYLKLQTIIILDCFKLTIISIYFQKWPSFLMHDLQSQTKIYEL